MQAVFLAPAHLVQQMLQMRGQRLFRAQALLQPFADRVANGPAGLVIEQLKISVASAIHDQSLGEFRLACLNETSQGQVPRAEFVSGRCASLCSLAGSRSAGSMHKKGPGVTAGALKSRGSSGQVNSSG
jgi:hypothetical protein